ncbi:MAG: hypothetical protein MJZ88_01575 [Paludibacteraceae bacterium]|nr:hypothetical protein [Paludibacteraceae bacterium]
MKRYTTLVLMILCAVWAKAEFTQAIGIQLGYTQPIYRLNAPSAYTANREQLDKTVLNGFKLGLIYDANIIKGFGCAMGLNYSFGASSQSWQDYPYDDNGNPTQHITYDVSAKESSHALEVFVDWQYKFEIAKNTWVILYSGPTIQCNLFLSAKEFYRDHLSQTEVKAPIKVAYEYLDAEMAQYYRRLNVTWGVGAGFQYGRYFIRGGYDFGLINPYSKQQFGEMPGYDGDDRYTRGRLDQWQIKLGIYLWEN